MKTRRGSINESAQTYPNHREIDTRQTHPLAGMTLYSRGKMMIFDDEFWFTCLIFISSVPFYSEIFKKKRQKTCVLSNCLIDVTIQGIREE